MFRQPSIGLVYIRVVEYPKISVHDVDIGDLGSVLRDIHVLVDIRLLHDNGDE